MAKAKAPGSKAKRTSNSTNSISANKEQTVTTNPTPTQDVAQSTPAVAPASTIADAKTPEAKVNAEPRINESRVNTEARMFEVRKPEARKNLVPINIEDEIRRRAYELYQQRGPRSGGEADDWLIAEREVMQRYHQQSA